MTWHPATTPPDDDRTVLVHLAPTCAVEPRGERVWLGYWTGSAWMDCAGHPVDVLAWSEVPGAPEVSP